MIKAKAKDKTGRVAHAERRAAWLMRRQAGISTQALTIGAKLGDVNLLDSGFVVHQIKETAESTRLSIKEIIDTMGMSERTYERRRVSGQLTIDESDKLVRIVRLYNMALEIFDESPKVNDWLKKPNRAFAGRTPLEMAKTEVGGRQVENLLGAMQHGVFY